LVTPENPDDMRAAHALQDGIQAQQADGPRRFKTPEWDMASQKKVRDALLVLASTVTDASKAFGAKSEVDPVQRLLGTASAWGANAPKDAIYLNVVPPKNDGKTSYRLDVKDVPVDGFWSVSVYNAEGYYVANDANAYTLNNVVAKSQGGTIPIQFGGCTSATINCLPIMAGWNYMVRLYRPRAEVTSGAWKFPAAYEVR
jgi:hypothetical protein